MTFQNSEKVSNFKAHELSWTVKKFGTRILRVSSSCPPIAHIHRWILWFHRWNHPSAFFGSKMKHKQHKKTTMKEKIEYKTKKKWHTHIYKRNKQRKLEIVIISNDNFKYRVISKFTVFKDLIITDNLQNLRSYQRSSKLKVSFSHKKLYSRFHFFKFYISAGCCEA